MRSAVPGAPCCWSEPLWLGLPRWHMLAPAARLANLTVVAAQGTAKAAAAAFTTRHFQVPPAVLAMAGKVMADTSAVPVGRAVLLVKPPTAVTRSPAMLALRAFQTPSPLAAAAAAGPGCLVARRR